MMERECRLFVAGLACGNQALADEFIGEGKQFANCQEMLDYLANQLAVKSASGIADMVARITRLVRIEQAKQLTDSKVRLLNSCISCGEFTDARQCLREISTIIKGFEHE